MRRNLQTHYTLPLGFEFLRGWWRNDRGQLPRELQNSCRQEWGEMSSDQPEFFWQICYLRHISLSSWATANHSLPASRARRKMSSLSSATNKRKTNKVTFSRMTFMSDGKGAGHTSNPRSRFWRGRWGRGGRGEEAGAVFEELLGVWRGHLESFPVRLLICL